MQYSNYLLQFIYVPIGQNTIDKKGHIFDVAYCLLPVLIILICYFMEDFYQSAVKKVVLKLMVIIFPVFIIPKKTVGGSIL